MVFLVVVVAVVVVAPFAVVAPATAVVATDSPSAIISILRQVQLLHLRTLQMHGMHLLAAPSSDLMHV